MIIKIIDILRKIFKMINIYISIIKNILTIITIKLYHKSLNHTTILHRTNIVHVVIVNVISLSEIIRIGMKMDTQLIKKSLNLILLSTSITSREMC